MRLILEDLWYITSYRLYTLRHLSLCTTIYVRHWMEFCDCSIYRTTTIKLCVCQTYFYGHRNEFVIMKDGCYKIHQKTWCVIRNPLLLKRSFYKKKIFIFWSQKFRRLTYCVRVTQICVSQLGQHWLRQWLVASSPPSRYFNQCWITVYWTLMGYISVKYESQYNNYHARK